MADAQYEVGMNTRQLEAGAKRVEKATMGMRKSTKNGAMAFLEATRAMEDFAFAGIRGAANNLPGIAMSMGLGAGVAGAATIMALSLMGVSTALGQFKKASEGAADASNAFADSMMRSVEAMRYLDQDRMLSQIDKLMTEGVTASAAQNGSDIIKKTQEDIAKANSELDFGRELAAIGGATQTPAEKFADDAAKAIEAARQWERAVEEIGAEQKRLRIETDDLTKANSGYSKQLYNQEVALRAAQASLTKASSLVEDKGITSGGLSMLSGDKARTLMEWVAKAATTFGVPLTDLDKNELINQTAKGDDIFRQLERAANKNKERAEAEVAEKQRALDVTKKLAEEDFKRLQILQKGVEAAKENRDTAKKLADEAAEEARKAEMRQRASEDAAATSSTFDKFRMSQPSLSSLASVGLSGNETQSALASFNVQREMLVELKKHSRLLAKPRTGTATYGRG